MGCLPCWLRRGGRLLPGRRCERRDRVGRAERVRASPRSERHLADGRSGSARPPPIASPPSKPNSTKPSPTPKPSSNTSTPPSAATPRGGGAGIDQRSGRPAHRPGEVIPPPGNPTESREGSCAARRYMFLSVSCRHVKPRPPSRCSVVAVSPPRGLGVRRVKPGAAPYWAARSGAEAAAAIGHRGLLIPCGGPVALELSDRTGVRSSRGWCEPSGVPYPVSWRGVSLGAPPRQSPPDGPLRETSDLVADRYMIDGSAQHPRSLATWRQGLDAESFEVSDRSAGDEGDASASPTAPGL